MEQMSDPPGGLDSIPRATSIDSKLSNISSALKSSKTSAYC
jgi:hypothetical protein